ncbi:MAG: hypothetical protein K5891_06980 [Lachnospiraceae bacterium]|nr:hypothetical protein [Lachnospiraceae bacterium]
MITVKHPAPFAQPMRKEYGMGEKNNVNVHFLKDPERFAEVFNGYFGNGEKLIDPACLEDMSEKLDGPMVTDPETGKQGPYVERIRDVCKCYKGETILRIFCLEDQSYIDYTAAVRTLAMDGLGYQEQLDRLKKKHKEANDLTGDERLSGIGKDEKLIPIITLWWYHGKKTYDGPRRLKDSLMDAGTPWSAYVADYPLNVLTDQVDPKNFPGDFGVLYEALLYQNDPEGMRRLFENDLRFQHVNEETIKVLSVNMGNNALWEDRNRLLEKDGRNYNMCLAFDMIKEEGRAEGIKEGREEGREQSFGDAIKALMETQGVTIDTAMTMLKIPEEKRDRFRAII